MTQKEEHEISDEAKQRAKNYMSLKGALEPKQEPTLEEDEIIDISDHDGIGNAVDNLNNEPPQETLEEAADIDSKNHYKDQSDYWAIGFDSFKRGAKWQAERMYSEVIEFAEWIRIKDFQTASKNNWIGLDMKYYTTQELFEQFKKKQDE